MSKSKSKSKPLGLTYRLEIPHNDYLMVERVKVMRLLKMSQVVWDTNKIKIATGCLIVRQVNDK